MQAPQSDPCDAPHAPAANDAVGGAHTLQPLFTGSGKEYFRIWLVNLTLTVATLGIYSAWAKVRRLQYFDRNTVLAGAVFDFRGAPMAILRGRLLALVMLIMYHYAFGFSPATAIAVVGALGLALPFLMRGALRFRLHNTEYRGLRFGFGGSAVAAYLVFLPILLMLVLPGLLAALFPGDLHVLWLFALYLAWPLLHARLKAYQHGKLRYGAAVSRYQGSSWAFYRFYATAIGLLLAVAAALFLLGVAGSMALKMSGAAGAVAAPLGAAALALLFYAAVLLTFPYVEARARNFLWNHTEFPGLRLHSSMSARAFARLQLVNVLLTLLTLGLYRPFAVVRVHRFKLAALSIVATAGFEQVINDAASGTAASGAAGDGAADFFGFDLSW